MRPFTLLLFVLLAGVTTGQQWNTEDGPQLTPRIRQYAKSDYGADNQNWDITQSPEGVLYVANSGGVLRFDGLNWSVHQLPGRPSVRCVTRYADRLYVGGYGEFGYFRLREGQLGSYVSLSATLPPEEQGEEIWNIELLDGGAVVFQSFSRLYWYVGDALRVAVPGDIMFAHAAGEALLYPVTGAGIYRQSPGKEAVPLPNSDPGGQPIVGLAGSADELLVATAGGVFRYGHDGYGSWSTVADSLLFGQQINRLIRLGGGEVAVGTITSGVYVFDSGGKLLHHLSYGRGLSNNTVLALFEDRDGNLWTGLDGGLNLIVRSEPLLFYRSGVRPIGSAYAAAHYGGSFYVGTNQGLFRYRPEPGQFILVPGTAGQVWELRATPYGLLCGHNDGTFLVEEDRANLISPRSGGWQSVFVDGDSTRLLQANYAGLSLIDLAKATGSGAAEAEHRLEGLLAPLRYLAFTGPRRVLALHGSRGAYDIRLSADLRSIERVDTLTSPDLIRPLLVRFGDTLLVQTDDGIYRYRDGAFNELTAFRGAALTPGTYVLPGREGSGEWFKVDPDRIVPYRKERALAAYPVTLRRSFPALVATTDSTYLFCLDDGFALFDATGAAAELDRRELLLDYAGVTGRRVEGAAVSIPYAENDLRFAYALPVLDRPIRYRSRLLGFSDAWSEWSTLGAREFTNLEEGAYRFEVEADWFGAGATASFFVRPPWYRTGLAYTAYALFLVGLLYALYLQHRKRLRLQARKLEALRQRQLQRQRIEARNEQLEAENRRKSRELANTTLTLAKKNEMLLDLKGELSKSSGSPTIGKSSQKLLRLIDRNLNNEEDWAIFESHFNEVHEAFLKRLRGEHADLTSGDLRLAAYVRMDLSSKEIAPLLHISIRGVENKRYRLRKKLGLESNDNLNQYLHDF
ncbi:two component regulator with propeller domain [Neolewinella xylanilytica]|uniref:Two component regulator with propeller domain n=1 Tax=Neolewinella xylanilytica TaxID=1514080 RepID=A0A2S6I0W5_9BACT|nr:two-component regulator propeller domain-containing protein [Neolewinella xylanilytica]PPK84586.1 two component regulator with propeller domain [Neolewinella xylanilytica]